MSEDVSPSPEASPNRFRVLVAYDGRPFEGWQSQVGGNTVQDRILEALRVTCPEITTVQGSGRTDAGVSASGQVAHFDAPAHWSMDATSWQKALNARLPPEIRILKSESVSSDFHARFAAERKTYRYRICVGEVLPPLLVGLAWHRRGLGEKERERLRSVLSLFEGEHDFRAFSARRKDGKDETRDTTRILYEASIRENSNEQWDLIFEGNGFLYKMVRFLVGSAVYVISGKVSEDNLRLLLSEGKKSGEAPYCAPPDGLSLEQVSYPPPFDAAPPC